MQLQQTSTKSGSKAVAKRDGRDSNYNHVSVQNYTVKQSCMHHAVSCREFVKSLPKQQHADRRFVAKLCHLFKIVNKIEDFSNSPISFKSLHHDTRHSHSWSLNPIHSHSSQFYYSFFPHSISLWNSLSYNIVNSSSLNLFKFNLIW